MKATEIRWSRLRIVAASSTRFKKSVISLDFSSTLVCPNQALASRKGRDGVQDGFATALGSARGLAVNGDYPFGDTRKRCHPRGKALRKTFCIQGREKIAQMIVRWGFSRKRQKNGAATHASSSQTRQCPQTSRLRPGLPANSTAALLRVER